MVFKNGVRKIQATGYNGAHTVITYLNLNGLPELFEHHSYLHQGYPQSPELDLKFQTNLSFELCNILNERHMYFLQQRRVWLGKDLRFLPW